MQFYEASLPDDVTHLDHCALENGGVVASIGYGFATTSPYRIVADWEIRWTNRQGMGNHGRAILIPRSSRSRALWLLGQIRFFRAAGVPALYADRIARSRLRRRHELAAALAAVLAEPAFAARIANVDMWDRHEWTRVAKAWGDVAQDIATLSCPRLDSLSAILRDVL